MGKTVLLYANGNREISTGHLRRCLTVARAVASKGMEAKFIVSDTESEVWLKDFMKDEEHSYPILKTNGNYNDPAQEIETMLRFVKEAGAEFLFMDSYFADDAFFPMWKSEGGCKTGIFEDFGLDRAQSMWEAVDLVVNYDISEPFVSEGGRQVPLYRHVKNKLVGCAYAPLRSSFKDAPFSVWEEAKRLMITTGGGDPYGICEALVRECLRDPELKDMELHVIAGAAFSKGTINAINDIMSKSENVILHRAVRDMAVEMSNSDMFVSGAGTTLYELCAVGVPGISFIMEDNQIAGAVQFEDENLIPCAGDIRADKEGVIGAAIRELKKLKSDPAERSARSAKMRQTIDGNGADRIAEAIASIIGED